MNYKTVCQWCGVEIPRGRTFCNREHFDLFWAEYKRRKTKIVAGEKVKKSERTNITLIGGN